MPFFRLAPNVKEDGTEKASTPFAEKIEHSESRAQDMLQNERTAIQELVAREREIIAGLRRGQCVDLCLFIIILVRISFR